MTRIIKSPTMTGTFAGVAQEFIQYKRSTGFKYADEPKCLSRFCRFSEEQGVTEIEISRALAEKWIAPREGESEKSRSHRITCIRQFAMIYVFDIFITIFNIPMCSVWICILCMKFSTVMVQGAFPCHKTNCPLQ